MDLSILQAFIPNLAGFLNVEPATALLFITLLVTVANLIGRLIPDDKVGVLGFVRDLCKLIGAYTPNRTASNPTPTLPRDPVEGMENETPRMPPPAFPGLVRDTESER
jgi:hypothetical protein